MDKIFKKLAEIPNDKLLHSFYGILMYAILILFITPILAFTSVLFTAIAKEIYDEFSYGGFSEADIGFTILMPFILFLKDVLNAG